MPSVNDLPPPPKGMSIDDLPPPPVSNPSVSDYLSDAGKAVLGGVAKVGRTIDRFGGAPTRAAIGALQNDVSQPGQAVQAFKNQFGADPSLAPTGQDIARKAGVPDTRLSDVLPRLYTNTGEGMSLKKGGMLDPSASGVAGTAIDVAADPITYLPVGKVAQGIAGGLAKSADKIGGAVNATGRAVGSAGTATTAKIGSMLTGVPEQEIKTYIKNYPEVSDLIEKYGKDLPGGADEIRQGFQASIRSKRRELGGQIGKALDGLPDSKAVDVQPVLDKLQEVQGRLNKNLRFEESGQIDDLVNRIKAVGGAEGKATPKEMYDIKEFLQDRAKGSYQQNGQIFVPGKDAQLAAKNGAATARTIVNTMSPTTAEANNQLAKLHDIEDVLNKNLIAPGSPDAALGAAGAGTNPRYVQQLQKLGEASGSDMLGQAQNYAAARQFANPGLSSADSTGKGVERMLKASLIGQVAGGPVAAGAAALLSSPAALKYGIQMGRIPVSAIQKIAGAGGALSDATIQKAYQVLQTKSGRQGFEAALQSAKAYSVEGGEGQTKGPEAWAQTGLNNLGISGDLANKILSDPKGKQLLMQASDLKPGSPAMNTIRNQIQKGFGQ